MCRTSIIVPVYNTADYLKECFESIYNQTQKEIEVIAINDGSTDNSLEILEEIKREHPDLIIYSQENRGLGDARNKGIELAIGEYIYFIDSDDCLAPEAMETCYQYAAENHLDVVMFDAEVFGDIEYKKDAYDRKKIISDQEAVLSGEVFACKYFTQAFYPNAYLIYTARTLIEKYHLRFLPRIYYEDNVFYCKMLPLAERVMYIPQTLYKRRYRENSITMSSFDLRHARDYLQMIRAVSEEKYSSNMETVIRSLELSFLNNLLDNCRNNNLLNIRSFALELYDAVKELAGGDIEKIVSFQHIDIIGRVVEEIAQDVVPSEIRKKIQHRKKEIVREIFSDIPLQSKETCVGIYGTGKNTERFLAIYKEFVGEIRANLLFINSNAISGSEQYQGYDVLNGNDIGGLPMECIVIASSRYENEICRKIKEMYGDMFRVIRLRTDLGF